MVEIKREAAGKGQATAKEAAPLSSESEPGLELGGATERVEDTPEFQKAVQNAVHAAIGPAVSAAVSVAVSEALAKVGAAPAGIAPDLKDLFAGFAASVADLAYQGNKADKPIDPKVIAARASGLEKMNRLIAERREAVHDLRQKTYAGEEERTAAIRAAMPKYRVVGRPVINERQIEPFQKDPATKAAKPTEIYYLGEPGDALRPANAHATAIFEAFRESRGNLTALERRAIKPLWMTDGGLIIEGGVAPIPGRREIAQQERASRADSDLDVPEGHDPSAPFVNVLGTVHEPAQQNWQGKPI